MRKTILLVCVCAASVAVMTASPENPRHSALKVSVVSTPTTVLLDYANRHYMPVPPPVTTIPAPVVVVSKARPTPPVAHAPIKSPPTTSARTTRPSSPGPAATGGASALWSCIGARESGNNPTTNTGNGYYGMYQDTLGSWVSGGGLAYAPRPDLAGRAAQLAVNKVIQQQQGWRAWPNTSRMCGA